MTPILYSFRRCPYAIRARMALSVSQSHVELREVVLRDKPAAFLAVSPSATVPCLHASDGVIDESLDVMIWALRQNDPEGWLDMPQVGWDWIARCDGPFKRALDRTKYAVRFSEADVRVAQTQSSEFLGDLNAQLGTWMFEGPSIADYAILPFVRQFAFIDKTSFDAEPWPALQSWLDRFLASERFEAVMKKYPQWVAGDAPIYFP